MFLVMVHHNFDDLPVRLFNNEADARAFALCTDQVSDELLKVFKLKRTDAVLVSVVSFDEQTGEPTHHQTVRHLMREAAVETTQTTNTK